jgi:hypothetical protein
MPRFSWLHLTDLHYGLSGQAPLWPNVKESFFEDLSRLHEHTGPWSVVLFSGDLVQQGTRDEFTKLEELVLGPLWAWMKTLGSEPHLLAVPGNHDLIRPDSKKPSAALRQLLRRDGFAEIADEFFEDPFGEYRGIVTTAFAEYAAWWQRTPYRHPNVHDGILPGEFGVSLALDGARVGVLGLNTTFLQLAGGDYLGRLAWDSRQFHAAATGDLKGDGPGWVKQHHLCLLMTHQGPDWLDETSGKSVYPEINPAGRFAVHLFGHMHENVVRGSSVGGGKIRWQWQGNSIFGMEKFGDPPSIDRRHGYSVGTIDLEEKVGKLRHWPRKATRDSNGLRFERDVESCVLDETDGATHVTVFELIARANKPGPTGTQRVELSLSISERQLLEIYLQAARKQWDIVDLAGLPEDERHLAMQQFLVRQLFVPLRLIVEAAAAAELSDRVIQELETRRLTRRTSHNGSPRPGDEREKFSIGARLMLPGNPLAGGRSRDRRKASASARQSAPRILILGDPGGGKTTLMRWLATALLMRRTQDPDLSRLPDAESLPDRNWLPILVRCRDLEKSRIVGQRISIADILRQTLVKLEIHDIHVDALVELFRKLLDQGEMILLFDGLDEIADPQLRAQFCGWLESTVRTFPSPFVATSRIVGYREMKRRLGAGFEHATLADLTPEDKDDFIQRWCDVTIPDPVRRRSETEKLTEAVHGRYSDRIERLTGNPMLLTTLALVQRKLGKLPSKRHKLYWEAVGVLLNWRTDVDEPLDPDEALPQLEYVAYAMCDRGTQQLRRDTLLALLEAVRRDYPNIRPVQNRTPETFLTHLERRTGLLVETGHVQHDGRPVPVYEFRHLTFQEYLAGLALVEGRFPGYDPRNSLAERVAPLAGRVVESEGEFTAELQVSENWREAIRLCVACCNDGDVDSTLSAILTGQLMPLSDFQQERKAPPTAAEPAIPWVQSSAADGREIRPRAILAALCLADEPNVSQPVGLRILERCAEQIGDMDGSGTDETVMDQAMMELGRSEWSSAVQTVLVKEFQLRPAHCRGAVGGVCSQLEEVHLPDENEGRHLWFRERIARLTGDDVDRALISALGIMGTAFSRTAQLSPDLIEGLMTFLAASPAAAHACSWSLFWLAQRCSWMPSSKDFWRIHQFIIDKEMDSEAAYFLSGVIRRAPSTTAVTALRSLLTHRVLRVKIGSIESLGEVSDPSAASTLRDLLRDLDRDIREAVVGSLAKLRGHRLVRQLVSRDFDGFDPWLDPAVPIDSGRVGAASQQLDLSEAKVRDYYEGIANDFGLTLSWRSLRN